MITPLFRNTGTRIQNTLKAVHFVTILSFDNSGLIKNYHVQIVTVKVELEYNFSARVNCTENCALSLVLNAPSPFPLPPGERVLFPSLDGRGKGRVILAAILNAADYSLRVHVKSDDPERDLSPLIKRFGIIVFNALKL